jgi:hypothetical protein
LQGIWTDEFDTPLERSAQYENQEFLTQAQRAELDNERRALLDRDERGERGTEADVSGAYSFAVFLSTKHTGTRMSLIVDPPNGRIPSLAPEAQKAAAADREFHLALLQSTQTCKNKGVVCSGGKYDPTSSPQRAAPPPRYNTIDLGRINRLDGPEGGALADRCLTGGLPEFGTRLAAASVPNPQRHLDVLRRGTGAGMAAKHRHERKLAFAAQHPPVVWRLARPLGGQYARHRRDNLQPEDRLSGVAREFTYGRALDTHRANLARSLASRKRNARPIDSAANRVPASIDVGLRALLGGDVPIGPRRTMIP